MLYRKKVCDVPDGEMTHTYTCRAQSKQVFLSLSRVSLGSLAVQGLLLEHNDFPAVRNDNKRAWARSGREEEKNPGRRGGLERGHDSDWSGIMTRVLASKVSCEQTFNDFYFRGLCVM